MSHSYCSTKCTKASTSTGLSQYAICLTASGCGTSYTRLYSYKTSKTLGAASMPANEVCTYRLSSYSSFDMKIDVSNGNVTDYDTEVFLYDGYSGNYTSKGNLSSGSIEFKFGGNTKEYVFVVVVPRTGGSPFWITTSDVTYVFPWWGILLIIFGCFFSFFCFCCIIFACIVSLIFIILVAVTKSIFKDSKGTIYSPNTGMTQPGLQT
jgi:hypothetical protein